MTGVLESLQSLGFMCGGGRDILFSLHKMINDLGNKLGRMIRQ